MVQIEFGDPFELGLSLFRRVISCHRMPNPPELGGSGCAEPYRCRLGARFGMLVKTKRGRRKERKKERREGEGKVGGAGDGLSRPSEDHRDLWDSTLI